MHKNDINLNQILKKKNFSLWEVACNAKMFGIVQIY